MTLDPAVAADVRGTTGATTGGEAGGETGAEGGAEGAEGGRRGTDPWAGSRRPVLSPAARLLWRDAETLQLGAGRGTGVVLSGIDPAVRAVVDRLDGSLDGPGVLRYAGLVGCPPERARALLELLDDAGLLLTDTASRTASPPPGRQSPDPLRHERAVHDRRRAACVRVVGAGRVGAPLAGLLAAAGVGALDLVDGGLTGRVDLAPGGLTDADLGLRRDVAAAARATACAGGAQETGTGTSTSTGTGEQPRAKGRAARRTGEQPAPVPPLEPRAAAGLRVRPDLVVLAPVSPADLREDLSAVPPGAPHLLAEVRDAVGVVGPLVVPGRTPCLRCLDLTRTDRDPAWPQLSMQLAESASAPCDSVLATAVATQAALQVLRLLDGGLLDGGLLDGGLLDGAHVDGSWPAAVGGTLELGIGEWRWRRRSWPLHPDCRCATRAA